MSTADVYTLFVNGLAKKAHCKIENSQEVFELLLRVCLTKTGKNNLDYTDGFAELFKSFAQDRNALSDRHNFDSLIRLFEGFLKKTLYFLRALGNTEGKGLGVQISTFFERVPAACSIPEENKSKFFECKKNNVPSMNSGYYSRHLTYGADLHKTYHNRNKFIHKIPDLNSHEIERHCLTVLHAYICVVANLQQQLSSATKLWSADKINEKYSHYLDENWSKNNRIGNLLEKHYICEKYMPMETKDSTEAEDNFDISIYNEYDDFDDDFDDEVTNNSLQKINSLEFAHEILEKYHQRSKLMAMIFAGPGGGKTAFLRMLHEEALNLMYGDVKYISLYDFKTDCEVDRDTKVSNLVSKLKEYIIPDIEKSGIQSFDEQIIALDGLEDLDLGKEKSEALLNNLYSSLVNDTRLTKLLLVITCRQNYIRYAPLNFKTEINVKLKTLIPFDKIIIDKVLDACGKHLPELIAEEISEKKLDTFLGIPAVLQSFMTSTVLNNSLDYSAGMYEFLAKKIFNKNGLLFSRKILGNDRRCGYYDINENHNCSNHIDKVRVFNRFSAELAYEIFRNNNEESDCELSQAETIYQKCAKEDISRSTTFDECISSGYYNIDSSSGKTKICFANSIINQYFVVQKLFQSVNDYIFNKSENNAKTLVDAFSVQKFWAEGEKTEISDFLRFRFMYLINKTDFSESTYLKWEYSLANILLYLNHDSKFEADSIDKKVICSLNLIDIIHVLNSCFYRNGNRIILQDYSDTHVFNQAIRKIIVLRGLCADENRGMNIDFSNMKLRLADFSHLYLRNITFQKSDLSYAEFISTVFRNCDLQNANLENAKLEDCIYENTNLEHASFLKNDMNQICSDFCSLSFESLVIDSEEYNRTDVETLKYEKN